MSTSTVLSLNRADYLDTPDSNTSLDYLSAKYKNIQYLLAVDTTFTVTLPFVANPFGISYNVYNNKGYWWVILLYNGIVDIYAELVVGVVLKLPSLASINALLGSQPTTTLGSVLL